MLKETDFTAPEAKSSASTGGKKRQAWLVRGVIIGSILLAIWLSREPVIDLMRFIADREAFSAYIKEFGLWGPSMLAIFQFLQVIVALLPGHAISVASGFIYGLLPGFIFNLATIVLGSLMAFYLARWFGRPLVIRLAPEEVVDRWDQAAQEHGFAFFLTSYLLPVFPADTMNFVAGLSTLTVREFILANAIGRTPATMLITAVGAYGLEIAELGIPRWGWAAFIIVSVAAYWGWQYFFHRYRQKRAKRKQQK